jgi:hypothetical protein
VKINIQAGKLTLTALLLVSLTAVPFSFARGAGEAETAGAAETSGGATVDLLSNYVWRGQTLSGDDGVVQPSMGITFGNFGVNLWANYDVELDEHNETDLTLTYGLSREKLSVEAGFIYYALDGAEDTQEVYLSLAYDTFLSPSVTVYYDFDEGDGAFLIASVGHSLGLTEEASLNLGASASVNIDNEVMGLDSKGDPFTDLYNGEVSASISIPLGKNISIEPRIAYSFPLSSDAEDVFEGLPSRESDIIYGGVGLSLAF